MLTVLGRIQLRTSNRIRFVNYLHFILSICCVAARAEVAAPSTNQSAPRVFQLDAQFLHSVRERIQKGDSGFTPALTQLKEEASETMTVGPFSVVDKTNVPPSGDKHDYMSLAPYWWPNERTPDGLPYVRHDGRRNPANRTSDRRHLGNLIDTVQTLSLAFYFTGEEKYAGRAALLLRVWFLDPETRMNPNFEFAQAVPGSSTGRSYGLIETKGLVDLLDAVALLAESDAWTASDERELREWFGEFLDWMRESENGRREAAARNNHGTYYDLQVATFALFTGRGEIATNILKQVSSKRIARQIEPDGRQPLELARTNGWHYSLMNLRGLMSLARVGENVGVDLWHFETPDDRSIPKALDCLIEYAEGRRAWLPGRADSPSWPSLAELLRTATVVYPDRRYKEILSKMIPLDSSDRANLLYPRLSR